LSWSPDGTEFVYARDDYPLGGISVFVSSMDGADVREILRVGPYQSPSPTWGPGPRIAFLRDVATGGDDIYTIDSDGTRELRLTNDSAIDLEQEWSPDGTKLLFLSDRNREPGDVFDVFTIRADGTGLTNLTAASTTSDTNADWSPDGTRVAFTTQDASAGLFAVDTSGLRRTRLTRTVGDEHDYQPDWQPLLRSSFRNAEAFCRAHLAAVGPRQFAVRYGKGRKLRHAFRRCVRGAR
jgi:Tol biopolymer transport system component